MDFAVWRGMREVGCADQSVCCESVAETLMIKVKRWLECAAVGEVTLWEGDKAVGSLVLSQEYDVGRIVGFGRGGALKCPRRKEAIAAQCNTASSYTSPLPW